MKSYMYILSLSLAAIVNLHQTQGMEITSKEKHFKTISKGRSKEHAPLVNPKQNSIPPKKPRRNSCPPKLDLSYLNANSASLLSDRALKQYINFQKVDLDSLTLYCEEETIRDKKIEKNIQK